MVWNGVRVSESQRHTFTQKFRDYLLPSFPHGQNMMITIVLSLRSPNSASNKRHTERQADRLDCGLSDAWSYISCYFVILVLVRSLTVFIAFYFSTKNAGRLLFRFLFSLKSTH